MVYECPPKVSPENEIISNYEFKFLVVASGKNVAIDCFDRRSLDAKLAIAVTANFVNSHTAEEAEVRQISGIAKQFHQVRCFVSNVTHSIRRQTFQKDFGSKI